LPSRRMRTLSLVTVTDSVAVAVDMLDLFNGDLHGQCDLKRSNCAVYTTAAMTSILYGIIVKLVGAHRPHFRNAHSPECGGGGGGGGGGSQQVGEDRSKVGVITSITRKRDPVQYLAALWNPAVLSALLLSAGV
jgi:hypothetical protein